MTQVTGSQLVAEQLRREGVDTLFYIMGGPIIDVAGAAQAEGIRTIDVRHEQAAAMAAHAYARATGRPGVCLAASGPATTNLLTGVANAFTDAAPVIALGGASAVNQFGMDAFQEFDQVGCFRPVTRWAERVYHAARLPELVNTAFRLAPWASPYRSSRRRSIALWSFGLEGPLLSAVLSKSLSVRRRQGFVGQS